MKRYYFNIIIFILGSIFLPDKTFSQCPDKNTIDSISSLIKENEFVIVREHTLDIKTKEDKSEKSSFSYLFHHGTTYLIYLIDPNYFSGGTGSIEAIFFDKKNFFFFGTPVADGKKYYNTLVFKCQTTGMYELQFKFLQEQVCGRVLVSTKKPVMPAKKGN